MRLVCYEASEFGNVDSIESGMVVVVQQIENSSFPAEVFVPGTDEYKEQQPMARGIPFSVFVYEDAAPLLSVPVSSRLEANDSVTISKEILSQLPTKGFDGVGARYFTRFTVTWNGFDGSLDYDSDNPGVNLYDDAVEDRMEYVACTAPFIVD